MTAGADLLADIGNEAIDLSTLRQLRGDVRVQLGGIRARGYEVGAIDLTMTANDGVVAMELSDVALFGGSIAGSFQVDAAADVPTMEARVIAEGVSVDGLLSAIGNSDMPQIGAASVLAAIKSRGASPRALVENLAGEFSLELAGGELLSALDARLLLPGPNERLTVQANLDYNAQTMRLEATLGLLGRMLSGERFDTVAEVTSDALRARYDGAVLRAPVPGLNGAFELDVPSVAALATWLGQPAENYDPDPGPIAVRATFAGDGAKVSIEDATIEGKAIKARLSGRYDGAALVPTFEARLSIDQADLDAYLPPRESPAAGQQAPQATAGWSDEPIDFTALGSANGRAEITLQNVRYRELAVDAGSIVAELADATLRTSIEGLRTAGGEVNAEARIDATQGAAAVSVDANISGVQARPFLSSFADFDRLSGNAAFNLAVTTSGRSQRDLVGALNGQGGFKFLDGAIHGINLAATLRRAGSLGLDAEASDTRQTDFAELSGTFTITDGVVANTDLAMLAPLVRLAGKGVVPLPPRTVDYALEANLVGSLEGQAGQAALAGIPIPIHITGSWDSPQYGVDWQSVFSAAAADPARLQNMPNQLRDAAQGFGVDLAAPDLQVPNVIEDVLRNLPGIAQPQPDQPAAAPAPAPDPLQQLRNLFGR